MARSTRKTPRQRSAADVAARWEVPTVAVVCNGQANWNFQGVAVASHLNPDGRPNGVIRVQVVDPMRSWWRVGGVVDVGPVALMDERTPGPGSAGRDSVGSVVPLVENEEAN